jgi:hypothetical protein
MQDGQQTESPAVKHSAGESAQTQVRKKKRSKPKANVPPLLWRTLNFRCSFCLKVMKPMEMSNLDKFFFVLGFRRHSCPHCFDARMLPCHYMKYLLAPFRFLYLAFMEDVD